MKIIYVFDDTRPSDRKHAVLALSEDGKPVALAHFDDWTLPYARFAMQVDHECDATGSNAVLVAQTRAETLAGFNKRLGEGQWTAVWLDHPRTDPGWLNATRLLHEEVARHEAEQLRAAREAASTVMDWLPRALGIQFKPAEAAAKPTTH